MNSALIISQGDKSVAALGLVLKEFGVRKIDTVETAGLARRKLIDNDYDLCLVNSPLGDEFGDKLAMDISDKGISCVILLIKSDFYDEVTDKVSSSGVITMSKPLNKTLFWNALNLTRAAHKKMEMMQKENKKLLRKIEDIRLIDRAKCILVSYLSMTESEAHRYIEKQAMDMRLTKKAVAQEILNTYDN